MEEVNDYLVNTVEHWAAKDDIDTDISLRSWWRPKTDVKQE